MRFLLLLLLLLLFSCGGDGLSGGTTGGGSEIIVWRVDSVLYGRLSGITETVEIGLYSSNYLSNEFADSGQYSEIKTKVSGDSLFQFDLVQGDEFNLIFEGQESKEMLYWRNIKAQLGANDSLKDTLSETFEVTGLVQNIESNSGSLYTLLCKGTPFRASVLADSTFTFPQLPRGKYEMVFGESMWGEHKDSGTISIVDSETDSPTVLIDENNTTLTVQINKE